MPSRLTLTASPEWTAARLARNDDDVEGPKKYMTWELLVLIFMLSIFLVEHPSRTATHVALFFRPGLYSPFFFLVLACFHYVGFRLNRASVG